MISDGMITTIFKVFLRELKCCLGQSMLSILIIGVYTMGKNCQRAMILLYLGDAMNDLSVTKYL